MFIPILGMFNSSKKNNQSMFQGLDHSLCHAIASEPLRCRILMRNPIILAQLIKLSCPFTPIVSQDIPWYSKLADDPIFQKFGSNSCFMFNNNFGLFPFGVMINYN